MQVSVSGPLRAAANGLETIDIQAETIRELLRKLIERYPKMERHMKEGIAVSLDGTIYRDARDIPIPPETEVFLLPRIQGG
jgi:molybdopterin converting factor small subunit